MITQTNIENIHRKIEPLLGLRSWGTSLGHGSFITIEFGQALPSVRKQVTQRGEWHLWIYFCVWYLEKEGELVAASEDARIKLESTIKLLDNKKILSIILTPPALETVFIFEDEVKLHTFPTSTEEDESWMLFTPDKNVLTIGPGTTWAYEKSFIIPNS